MTPISIIFSLNGRVSQHSDTNAANIINEIVRTAFENKNKLEGKPYFLHAANVLIGRAAEIQRCLLEDNRAWFSFDKADFEPFEIIPDRMSGGFSLNYTWNMVYTLSSAKYTWVDTLVDRTIVCHKADGSEIEFIPLNAFKLQLAE